VMSEIDDRVRLLLDAREAMPDLAYQGKSDREIMLEVIEYGDRGFRADGKNDEYLRAKFDAVLAQIREERAALFDCQKVVAGKPGLAAAEKSLLEDAQKRADEVAKQDALGGPPPGALVRK
jgi:hypothetical protein